MKFWIIVLFLTVGFFGKAQEVEHKGVKYEVKGDVILKDGKDVTSTLSKEHQIEIKTIFENTKLATKEAQAATLEAAAIAKEEIEAKKTAEKLAKERKEAEKAMKEAEKAQKRAEKEQKKAERALQNKQDAQDNFEKATKRLSKNQAKYDKLKRKGKLSPNDEKDWMKKLENYREDVSDAKEKLMRS